MKHPVTLRRQRGAVIITLALILLFLLGFMGIALDFGRLFIVKTELQTAVDSCALAAASELDGAPDTIARATSAGLTAGNLNKVVLQAANATLADADVTFSATLTGTYSRGLAAADAKYVKCTHAKNGLKPWLLQAMSAFTGDPKYAQDQGVSAFGVATLASAQSTCPMPVAFRPNIDPATGAPYPGPDYGLTVGEWVTMITQQSAFTGGHIGWMSLVEGQNGTNAIREQMKGHCGIKINSRLQPSDNGSKAALVPVWNHRFGLYAGAPDFTAEPFKRPDLSGYSYPLTGGPNVYSDFVNRRAANAACAASVAGCKLVGPFSFPGNINYIVPSGSEPGSHGAEGMNRRVVLLSVIGGADGVSVVGFACMLMLQPLSIPMEEVKFEYLGNAANADSPCSSAGPPGGEGGPRVPALVH
jgi:hypothetical protein